MAHSKPCFPGVSLDWVLLNEVRAVKAMIRATVGSRRVTEPSQWNHRFQVSFWPVWLTCWKKVFSKAVGESQWKYAVPGRSVPNSHDELTALCGRKRPYQCRRGPAGGGTSGLMLSATLTARTEKAASSVLLPAQYWNSNDKLISHSTNELSLKPYIEKRSGLNWHKIDLATYIS